MFQSNTCPFYFLEWVSLLPCWIKFQSNTCPFYFLERVSLLSHFIISTCLFLKFHFVHPVMFQYIHYIISVTTQQFFEKITLSSFMRHVSAVQPSSGKLS
jgi:hypothetical protein